MNTIKLDLLKNISATGPGVGQTWRGGKGTFMAGATTTFAPVQLEVKDPGGNWQAVGPDTTMAAAGPGGNFDLPPCELRANITSGSPSGMNAIVVSRQ